MNKMKMLRMIQVGDLEVNSMDEDCAMSQVFYFNMYQVTLYYVVGCIIIQFIGSS